MSSSQVDSGIWVPGFLASLAAGIGGGFLLTRLLFGSWLSLDRASRVATVRGRGARSSSEQLIVRLRSGPLERRKELEKQIAGKARELARALGQKFRPQ